MTIELEINARPSGKKVRARVLTIPAATHDDLVLGTLVERAISKTELRPGEPARFVVHSTRFLVIEEVEVGDGG